MGYNGEVYKEISNDFLKFTKEINLKSKSKKLIELYYFPEVKNEIEGFFNKAKHILENNDTLNPKVTAMVEILKDVSSKGDIVSKKSDLDTFLIGNGIHEFEKNIDFSNSENHQYNIISSEIVEEVNNYLEIEDCGLILETLNKISILRRNNKEENFENVKYILLSGNSKILKAAFNTTIFERFNIPLATNLNFIINRFWFKLNKGFSQKDFPSSFNIITKSQIILSKILNDSIGEKYDELQDKFKKGFITKEQAVNRIKDLRIQSKKPEEIKNEIASEILDFITIDSLEDYIENQNHYKEKSRKFDEISDQLIKKTENSKNLRKDFKTNLKERILEKQGIINEHQNNQLESTEYSNNRIKLIRNILILILVLFYLFLIAFIFYFGWEIMEKYTYIIGIPVTIILLGSKILKKPLNFENKMDSLKRKIEKRRIEKKSKYSQSEIDNAHLEIIKLKNQIIDLEHEE